MMESSRDERPDEYLLFISSTRVSVHCVTNYPHVSFLIMNTETQHGVTSIFNILHGHCPIVLKLPGPNTASRNPGAANK